eukprot:TCALIF_10436-PA protein Name:"Protein of unknown function" AED:0.14 eAED:0.14 QI:31/0.5/0.33/0.66/1/1/3/136/233
MTPNVSFKPCPENAQTHVEFRDPGSPDNALKSRMSIENENVEIPDAPSAPIGSVTEKESPKVALKANLKANRGSDSMRVVTSLRRSTQVPGQMDGIDSIGHDNDSDGSSESSLDIPNLGDTDESGGPSSQKGSGSNSSFEKIDVDPKDDVQSKEWSALHDDLYNEISTRLGPDQEMEVRRASTLQRSPTTELSGKSPSGPEDTHHLRPFSVELNVTGENQKRSSFYALVGEAD